MTLEHAEFGSVLKSYYKHISSIVSRDSLDRASIYEPARILAGPVIKGVKLSFLDLSSMSVTGSFKDWVACLTVAYCLDHGIGKFVTQSSGNTANALGTYASRVGLEAVILHPRLSRYKILSSVASSTGVMFIEVDKPEPQLKTLADEISQREGIPWLPTMQLQLFGNMIRAYFIEPWLRDRTGSGSIWHAQSLSSAFGPLGTYAGFREIESREAVRLMPRFLGIQQEAVRPFALYIAGAEAAASGSDIFEPTLFRSEPTPDLLEGVRRICIESEGTVIALLNTTLQDRLPQVLSILAENDLQLTRVPDGSGGKRVLEYAGVLCLAGVLEAIDDGLIVSGDSVLVAITGGLRPRSEPPYDPKWQVGPEDGLETVHRILRCAQH